MALNNLLNGYQLIDGTSDSFNISDFSGTRRRLNFEKS